MSNYSDIVDREELIRKDGILILDKYLEYITIILKV